jgi:transcriptional regulator with XRE-family HTH domain
MSRHLSKHEAIALFSSAKELAKALGISKSAVSQWPEGPIPDNHDLRIRYELKSEHFRLEAGDAGTSGSTDNSRQQRDI